MISETQIAYGSRVRRQGRSRALCANHCTRRCAKIPDFIRASLSPNTKIRNLKPELHQRVFPLDVFDDMLSEVASIPEKVRYILRRNPQRAAEMEASRTQSPL